MEQPDESNFVIVGPRCQPRKGGAPGEAAKRLAGGRSLPCQSRNNSTEPTREEPKPKLSGHAKKTAEALKVNVERFVMRNGLDNCGFLTLTLPEVIRDAKELSRRFNSLATHVLNPRYGEWLRVYEQHASGGWHCHLILDLGEDIRTGFDWTSFQGACECFQHARTLKRRGMLDDSRKVRSEARRLTKVYAGSASPRLREEWSEWRDRADKYGFGRTELVPIRKSTEAIGLYVGKYVSKHMDQRNESAKGVRLVGVSKGARRATSRFSWNSPAAYLWRKKLGAWSVLMGFKDLHRIKDELGSGWVWKWADAIMGFDLATLPGGFTYPKGFIALADGRSVSEVALDVPFHVAERKVEKFNKPKIDFEREQRIDIDALWNPVETCQTEREALEACIPRPPNERESVMRAYARSLLPYQRDKRDFHRWLREFKL